MMMLSVVDPVGTKGQKREECTVARFVSFFIIATERRLNLPCLYVAIP